MNIHEKILHLRTTNKMSQQALADAIGVSYQTVQQWENGKTAPSRKRVDAVAKALNTSVEHLLFGRSDDTSAVDTLTSRKVETKNVPSPLQYSVDVQHFRPLYVVGRTQGGLPERIWTDGDYPVGAADEFAEIATADAHAFLSPIIDTSMSPRYNPGEFALVEPGTEPELEDDVLVRLVSGETMLKRLISRRGGITLASYNEPGTRLLKDEDITWLYYVAHPVPARKIKQRI
jgi:transcriptional regulator with XRE-family HTH domain